MAEALSGIMEECSGELSMVLAWKSSISQWKDERQSGFGQYFIFGYHMLPERGFGDSFDC